MWRLWVVFLLFVGAVRAANLSASMSWGDGSASGSLVVNEETGAYTFAYNIYGNSSDYGHSAWLVYDPDAGGAQTVIGDSSGDKARTVAGVFTGGPGTVWVVAHGWNSGTPSDLHSDIKELHIGGKLTCQPRNLTTTGYLNSVILGTASGSKNGAAYNLSILSGPGVAAINSQNGEWTITPTGVGSIQAKFWLSNAGIWSRSDDVVVTFTIQPESPKKPVTISLPSNGGTSPVTYNLMQGGKSLGSYTQQPGAGARIFQAQVDTAGGAVTLVTTTGGVTMDGASVVQTSDGSGSISKPNHLVDNPSNLKDGQTFVVDGNGTITDSSTGKVVDQTTPTKTPDKNTSPVVWSAGNGSQEDLVTNTVYREGVGKVVQALEDQVKKILGEGAEKLPDAIAPQFEELAAHPTSSDMVEAVEGLLPAAPQFPSSVGRNPDLDVELGDMGGVFPRPLSVKLGVPASARTAAGWLRDIELYGLYVVFFLVCLRLIRKTFA